MISLLAHSPHVPPRARDALLASLEAPPARQRELLASAARALHAETALDCADVGELLSLDTTCG